LFKHFNINLRIKFNLGKNFFYNSIYKMAGGVMQLVAYGVQDVYLTGNPQITYWKVIYKRHTNFAIEPIENSFQGTADFGKSSVTALIQRNGDLITNCYLKATVSLTKQSGTGRYAFVKNLGTSMLRDFECTIGGTRMDRQLGDWMNVQHQLMGNRWKDQSYNNMIGNIPELTELADADRTATLYVPLPFWFNRNNGLALPLIALQYHDVRINFNFNQYSQLVVTEGTANVKASITDALLVIDYIFLDSEERKRFATSAHEYLIEQLQTPDPDTIDQKNIKYRLSFNHPCKFIAWEMQFGKYITGQKFFAYHPTDFNYVKKRTAIALFLLSLTLDGDNNLQPIGSVSGSLANYQNSNSVFYNNPDLTNFLAILQPTVIVVTKRVVTPDEETGYELHPNFPNDPFSYVEFLDDTWQSIPNSVISSTVSSLVSDTSGYMYNLLSNFFVSVYMPANYGLYYDGSTNPFSQGNIQLNGQDRFTVRDGNYFNYVQPYQHFSNTPVDGINVYSFSLNPEDHQPSGSCNFSRIDYAQLNLTTTSDAAKQLGSDSIINIYTKNYNVLRIMGGMGGLAYAN